MRSMKFFFAASCVLALSSLAYAELQNVEVGGQIRIRGNWYDFDDDAPETSFIEQRTRLSVKADFTDEVSAFIEVDNYNIWGTDFRSNYITGLDGAGGGDVALYQSYIEANEMWGTPLRLRIGRQELSFGNEWLVGVNSTSSLFTGLSFDAARLDYITDNFNVAAWASKLNETFGDAFEDDVSFYGIYGSYTGLEDVVIDAYWMYVRDDESLTAFDVDLHTVGLRGAGTISQFDFNAEVAYQFGEASLDRPFPFSDIDVDVGAFGGNLEVGYTFDVTVQPRIYLGFAYLEGAEDDELAFNRLFSNWEYTGFFANTEESNLLIYRGGVSLMPTEQVSLLLAVSYFQAEEESTVPGGFLGLFPTDGDDKLGWEVGLYADYAYSEDLTFRAGYAHFFGKEGLEDGNSVLLNGLAALNGDEDSDYDYVFVETEIKF
jgi:hypothetical protein